MSSLTETAPVYTERVRLLRLGSTRLLLRASSIAVCILAWHLASTSQADLGVVTFRNVPAPLEV
ncbi:MAG: hypothetical protein J0I90_00240, partial [Nitrosospira sp.]|nr:hypothetical protein [Nitrosospira sp.]